MAGRSVGGDLDLGATLPERNLEFLGWVFALFVVSALTDPFAV